LSRYFMSQICCEIEATRAICAVSLLVAPNVAPFLFCRHFCLC
jgi:hypothetical protein